MREYRKKWYREVLLFMMFLSRHLVNIGFYGINDWKHGVKG